MKDSSNQGAPPPYQILGSRLKKARELHSESVAEVSGAVEIDPDVLERIENGHERPSEDILMLLINHLNLQDQEAVQLWESAGYEGNDPPSRHKTEFLEKAAVIMLAMDVRTVYSDGIVIDANKSGIVLNFTQTAQTKDQHITISRVGMSYDQAEQVLAALQQAILYGKHAGPRRLPPAN